ncbi:DUF3797 domain-containing protein [Bacillus thuringiensis]|uniref:DUF3797 domain-containing protein n=1 Tax=Bacillus thuringiensis TaxID=1428 RepID=UPI001F507002|nr:DUF3797 domain-containing protein [Bacillus thuringiensis]
MYFLRISPLINDCPNCGNQFVGNGEGTLEVDDNIVKRTCKCGFNLVLVQILYKIYKGHRFLLESTLKQLIQITDEYIYSDF